jgi:hypothetical protein
MDFDFNLFYKVFTISFFILGPLLPAFLLYKIAPQDKILGKGNFAGFRINATGATAIFIILFAALYPKIDTVFASIDARAKYQDMLESYKKNRPWKVDLTIQLMNDTGKIDPTEYEKYIKQDSIMANPRPMWFDYRTQTLTFYIDNEVFEKYDGKLDGSLVLRNGFGTSQFKIDKKSEDPQLRLIRIVQQIRKAHTNNYASITKDKTVAHFKISRVNTHPPIVSKN